MKMGRRNMRRALLGISPAAVEFAHRGFRTFSEPLRLRLEGAGRTFLGGYHAALEQESLPDLERELNRVEAEWRGFAYEGAAMGLALLDALTPWGGSRWAGFVQGPASAHVYMAHVGVGWVWARVPFGRQKLHARLDPLLAWLAFDGWGFHEGFFHWRKYADGKAPPAGLKGYEPRAFNQGLGRAWWFVNGGNPAWIAETIARFPSQAKGDMWSGVGLAATCAGMLDADGLAELRTRAGSFAAQVAQGAAFAAKARQRAGNLTEYTGLATDVLCGMTAVEAARLCDQTLENLPATSAEPAYETWRRRIQREFAAGLPREGVIA
jgi:hypothetical protein